MLTYHIEELCSDRIDVSFWMAAAPNPVGDELTTSCSAGLLGLSESEAAKFVNIRNLGIGKITSQDYVTVDTAVVTVQVDALLVASPMLSENVTARVVTAIYEAQDTLRRNNRFLGALSINSQ